MRGGARTVLVCGATGTQGGSVARELLERGVTVRALTRDPASDGARELAGLGALPVRGDLDDPASLDRACAGVDGVYSVQTMSPDDDPQAEVRQGVAVLEAAQRANVAHLVYASVGGAGSRTGIPHFDAKHDVEQRVQAGSVPWTILRPAFFMANWRGFRTGIETGVLRVALPGDVPLQQIAPEDIGWFAAEAFTDPDAWLGRALEISGDARTMRQMAQIFSRLTGHAVRFEEQSTGAVEQAMGFDMAQMWRWFAQTGYSADIEALRRQHPEMLGVERYLETHGWARVASR